MTFIKFTPEDLHNMTMWYQMAFAKKDNSENSDNKTRAKIIGVLASEVDKMESRSEDRD